MLDFIVQNNEEIFFVVTFSSIALLILIESWVPLRSTKEKNTTRWINNIGLALLNFYFLAWIGYGIGTLSLSHWLQPDVTFTEMISPPAFVSIAITILISEAIAYWLHRGFHEIPFLWRIHSVHHNDVEMDVTTSHRHHPFEPMIFLLINLPVTLVIGPPIVALVVYNFIRLFVSMISHSNISLPVKLDKWLRYIIITPEFHRLHHSSNRKYTDSNYGVVLPWFDYFFGTATYLSVEEQKKMELGLETMRSPTDGRIDKLLLQPFLSSK